MQCANCNYVSVSKGGRRAATTPHRLSPSNPNYTSPYLPISRCISRYGATTATCDWFRNCTSGPLQTAFGGGTYTTFEVIRGRG